jgi:geranylgeranyl diphosphate synthase type I
MPEAELVARIEQHRGAVLAEMRDVIGDSDDGLFAWMRYHLGWETAEGVPIEERGGKMLRPLALLLVCDLVGSDPSSAVPAAAAIELVHNFSLLHDDIEDRSDARRGRATLWTFAGEPQAINTGDGMYTVARLAMHRLLDRGVPPERVLAAMQTLDQSCLRLVHGQWLDIGFEKRNDVTIEEYVAMAGGKTAAMFSAPFAIGARLGGASDEVVEGFAGFGQALGLAFQAVDDLLGIWGDRAITGKPVGDDLTSRKLTYPVLAAMADGGEEGRVLVRRYAEPSTGVGEVDELAALVAAAGGRAATERFAQEQRQRAMAALSAAGVDQSVSAICDAYADLMIERVS